MFAVHTQLANGHLIFANFASNFTSSKVTIIVVEVYGDSSTKSRDTSPYHASTLMVAINIEMTCDFIRKGNEVQSGAAYHSQIARF